MNYKKKITPTLTATMLLLSSQIYAAGFQLNAFSNIGLGRAYSGESAMVDNITSGSRNPASIAQMKRPGISVGLIHMDPDLDLIGISETRKDLDARNIAPNHWIPNLHYFYPVNSIWKIGGSISSNYGAETKFSKRYVAGDYAGRTDIETLNLNLSTAYAYSNSLSFGFGLNAVYAKAKIDRYIGESAREFGVPETLKALSTNLKEWGYGVNAGIFYALDDYNHYGFSYRSEVKIKLDGYYQSEVPSFMNDFSRAIPSGIPFATDGHVIQGLLTLRLPEFWEMSGWNKITSKWAVHYSIGFTNWQKFDKIKITDGNRRELFSKNEKFHNSYRIALGASYFYNKKWTFRTGMAFDTSPIPVEMRSISIPDEDRVTLSIGTSYVINDHSSIDIGLSHMHGKTKRINEGPYSFTSTNNTYMGGMNFNYLF